MIINDISQLNPISVEKSIRPQTVEQISQAVKNHPGLISIAGSYCSMGGQTAIEGSLHFDLRLFNKVLEFSPENKTIRVQTGITWREIQEVIDPYNLSVKIMQSYCNFTVGGTLSVNAHGRYIGLGPVILSVRSITLVLASGEIVVASPSSQAELFYGAIGGYGALGIIVEATLDLAENIKIERQQRKMTVKDYPAYFLKHIRNSERSVFHNADLYPPHYTKLRSVTWSETEQTVTSSKRLRPKNRSYFIEKYLHWAISETPLGKLRREYLFDPLLYLRKKIVYRNYEASYRVEELEPISRRKTTYVLQEYFLPIDKFEEFVIAMAGILKRFKVNVLNISVRHAIADPGSLLAWAQQEVFAFVLYYKQGTDASAKNTVAVWTRELIAAALRFGGTYYLPYQPHASSEQFLQAYPRAKEFFNLKKKVDPKNKFSNKLWEKYLSSNEIVVNPQPNQGRDFQVVFPQIPWRDKFYVFLQTLYNIFPEGKLHTLICQACDIFQSDEEIYRHLQKQLPKIKPFASELRYALPALIKQKCEIAQQTVKILGQGKPINGYVEIGSTGRYIQPLRKSLQIAEPIYLINDLAPTNSVNDLIERGSFQTIATFVPLNDYDPIDFGKIPAASVDLVTCYIGLHHAPLNKLSSFIGSIAKILRPGGSFIVRDHEVSDPHMHCFVSLAHTVFNLGLGVSWEDNQRELRHFTSTEALIKNIENHGLLFTGKKLLQDHDPTVNTLMQFIKAKVD